MVTKRHEKAQEMGFFVLQRNFNPTGSGSCPACKKQAGLEDRPDVLETDFVGNYAATLLRRMRMVLAPKGRSSNAPAIMVVGSGTGRTSY